MNVCIIGSTGHVYYVFEALRELPNVRITGIAPGSAGESVERLQGRVAALPEPPVIFDDYKTMLDKLKPDIAVIGCFFGDTARVAADALNCGCHVFVEKPVATTLDDLAMLREVHAKSGKQLAAMLAMRYNPAFHAARDAIQSGLIGSVRIMHMQKSYRLGDRGPHYRDRLTYGGTIPWVGSHAVDLLYWLSGETFQSVFAAHSRKGNRDHGELEMTALCHFTMSNEVFASASLEYLQPNPAIDDRIRVAGTTGILEVRGGKASVVNDSGEGATELALPAVESIFADFVRQIEGGTVARISAEDSFYVTEVCLKARQAADEERIVSLKR
jgi:predicted dehydrogenase